jgi:hypothetical protein
MKEDRKINSNHIALEFYNLDEIYFPNICIVCGEIAENRIKKSVYGLNFSKNGYKKNYFFDLPVCNDCKHNIEIKSGLSSKSGKLLLFSALLGIFISIILYSLIFSVFFSIGILAISIIFPYIHYRGKLKQKINLNDHLKININPNNVDSVELKFSNIEYADTVKDINKSKIDEKLKIKDIEKESQALNDTKID